MAAAFWTFSRVLQVAQEMDQDPISIPLIRKLTRWKDPGDLPGQSYSNKGKCHDVRSPPTQSASTTSSSPQITRTLLADYPHAVTNTILRLFQTKGTGQVIAFFFRCPASRDQYSLEDIRAGYPLVHHPHQFLFRTGRLRNSGWICLH